MFDSLQMAEGRSGQVILLDDRKLEIPIQVWNWIIFSRFIYISYQMDLSLSDPCVDGSLKIDVGIRVITHLIVMLFWCICAYFCAKQMWTSNSCNSNRLFLFFLKQFLLSTKIKYFNTFILFYRMLQYNWYQ